MLICPEVKILLKPLVCQFGLSISARVICCGDVLFDAQYIAQLSRKLGSKARVPVADDFRQESVRGEDMLSIECH